MKAKLKKIISPFFIVGASLFLLGLAVRIISASNTAFADFWQTKVASVPRAALAYITNIFPFSLA